MRQLIVSEFLTLDGVMEAPGGEPSHPHTGWTIEFHTPELVQYKFDEVAEAGALLLGRTTYESFAGSWPERTGPFADRMNAMPKYVASTTLAEPEWHNTTVLQGPVPEAVAALKRIAGGPIVVVGSATLVHALVEHDLVDEYRLIVFPVLIGGGLRLFPEGRQKSLLRLVDTLTLPAGVVVQTYHRDV